MTSEWYPIETAPKDGTPILVCSAGSAIPDGQGGEIVRPPRCYIAVWNAEGDSWVDEMGGFDGPICKLAVTGIWECDGGWFQPNEVTHWMPLPPPPHSKDRGDE